MAAHRRIPTTRFAVSAVSLLVALLLATGILSALLLTPASASDDGNPGSHCSTVSHAHSAYSYWTIHEFRREYDVVGSFNGVPFRHHYHEWNESIVGPGGYGGWWPTDTGTETVLCESGFAE